MNLLAPQDRHNLEVALATGLKALGGEIKPGGPPRSDMERKLQVQIDEIKAMLSKK